jgi:hypothetical protein
MLAPTMLAVQTTCSHLDMNNIHIQMNRQFIKTGVIDQKIALRALSNCARRYKK